MVKIKLVDEVTGYHHGQTDGTLSAINTDTEKAIGYADYTVFAGVLQISWIEVLEAYRRQGIARAMLRRLQSEQEAPLDFGMMTLEGTALQEAFEKELRS